MTRGSPGARRGVEALIIAALCLASFFWGTRYWNSSLRAGRQPAFYQPYFEPAVMLACGHGFRLAVPKVPAVTAFVQQKRDSLSCSEIPRDVEMTEKGLYQKPWMYLMATVALAWRVLGISWSAMGPLFGVIFGLTIAAAYAIFRLGMGRALSAAGAGALIVSSVHLQNLPHLRDYAKAPFTLALFALLGLIVARPSGWKRLLTIAACYGLVLGVGYGFRTDFLAEIPLLPIVVLAFAPGRLLDHLPMKGAAIAVCLAAFVVVAWPILTSVRERGGCQWHAVLLGLTDEPTDGLMVARAPYSLGHDFSDDFIYTSSTAYAARTQPGVGHIEYCSPDYDAATARYLFDYARVFPGDFLTRTLASIVQIIQLPFRWYDQPLPGWWTTLYATRRLVLKPLRGWGVLPVALTLLALMAVSPRLGLFALFFLLYVGGYPSLQFNIRHYFHLEFITWWAAGFVAERAFAQWRAADGSLRTAWSRVRGAYDWRLGFVRLTAAAAGILLAVLVTRGYQQVSATRLFEAYVDAPRKTVDVTTLSAGALHRVFARPAIEHDPAPPDLLEIDLEMSQCGAEPSVQFAYDRPFSQLTRDYRLSERSSGSEPTRVFQPIYAGFAGLRFSDVTPACLKRVSRVEVPRNVTLLLPATLAPAWRRQPMFERLKPWGWRW
jgi:hypothetical protein